MTYETPTQNYQSIFEYVQKNAYAKDNPSQDDFVDRLFSDKAKTQKTTVKQVLNEISLRGELHKNLLSRIDYETMKWDTYLMNLKDRGYEIDLSIPKRRNHIEDKLIQLEQEKRAEDLKYWEHGRELRKELMLAFNEYWLSFRKKEFLNDVGNENI